MKKLALLFPLAVIFLYFTLSSNSGGMPGNLTGNITSDGCGKTNNCHGKPNSGVLLPFLLIDTNGNSVANYTPGRNYIVKMVVANTTGATLPKFGFQFTVVSNATNTHVGQFLPSSLPAGERVDTLGTSVVVQQRYKLSPSVGTGENGSSYTATAGWIAPPAGTGRITVYGGACLVDNNGTADTLTDYWNRSSLYFDEETTDVPLAEGKLSGVTAWPNPVTGNLNLTIDQVRAEYVYAQIIDMAGRSLLQKHFNTHEKTVINTADWAPGLYQLVLKAGNNEKTIPIIKR